MFREMNLKNELLTEEESVKILQTGISGVLALIGDKGYPYGVPLNYVYHEGKVYFHGAKKGHKVDAIRQNEKASFTVIAKAQIVPEELTCYFKSVILFGKMCILEDEKEKRQALEILAEKYHPNHDDSNHAYIDKSFEGVCVMKMSVEHMTGKQAIELFES